MANVIKNIFMHVKQIDKGADELGRGCYLITIEVSESTAITKSVGL